MRAAGKGISQAGHGTGGEAKFQLQVKPVNHPLLSCFALAAGFVASSPAQPQGSSDSLEFGIALRSFLSVSLPLQAVEVCCSLI